MRTFSELLREYVARTGVSDAELARAVGVQRQTVFRWKEGLVARPRSAEDVVRLAAKLRLTSTERDEFLLAAGFPPMQPPAVTKPSEEAPEVQSQASVRTVAIDVSAGETASHSAQDVPRPQAPIAPRIWIIAVVALAIAAVAIFFALRPRTPLAAAGETLILVAEFGNYTGGAQGYNVAGRLGEALERELNAARLADTRVATWPDVIADKQAAIQALQSSRAALIVWGEYDSGRVVARFLQRDELEPDGRELALPAATPAELPAVINEAVPGEMRYLALYSLTQVYLHGGQVEAARAALGQAGLNLPEDAGTRAAHHFLWGYANQTAPVSDLDKAIEGYSAALALDANLLAARNNRAVAYLKRQAPGDLQGAIDDSTAYLDAQRDDPAAHNNRGSAYFFRGGVENARAALADFDRAVDLAPDDLTGYFNRGLARIRLGQEEAWREDLQRALAGGHPQADVGLCWGYSLSAEPATAVEHCAKAVESGDTGSLENLGVALARSEQFAEAKAALEDFRDTAQGAAKAAEVDAWLAALRDGKNPFDAETVRRLREE